MDALQNTTQLSVPPVSAPASKPDLTDLGDPTKVASQSLTFSEVLSALNPLQYIPVVGTIYRAITGDAAPQAAQILVSTLMGGPVGLITSAANAILEQSTGKDFGQHVLAMVMPSSTSPAESAPQVAAADPAPAAPAAATAAASQSVPVSPPSPPVIPAALTAAAAQGAAGGIAPLSRGLFGAPPPPSAAASLAGPMATGWRGSLRSQAGPNTGYTLADYRGFAGGGMPVVDNSRTSSASPLRNAPVPLQTSVPIAGEMARTPLLPAPGAPAPVAPASSSANAGADGQSGDWISAAMMRGLDRYREMVLQQEQQQRAPQVDTAL